MPHVSFVALSGFRVREEAMRELGMALPGLEQRAGAIAALPALGVLTLAGCTSSPWTCSYHAPAAVDDELIERLVDERPELVAVSALTASILEAYRLCDGLRRAGVRTVLGGLHATACPDEAGWHADAVVTGAGEHVWQRVLDDCLAGRMQGRYESPPMAGFLEGPPPRFDLVGRTTPRFTLQTARGCPWACEFCGASRLLGAFREKPPSVIRRELTEIRKLVARPHIELADDNTLAGPRDADELFAVLAEFDVRYFTEVDWRIGERPEVLAGLAASGCVQVLVGIESLEFRYPGMGAKTAPLPRIRDALAAIQESGVAVNGCFIVGADGETPASLERLIEFATQAPLADVQLTLQTPFPGTALYRRLASAGRLLPQRDWSHYTLFDVTYQPDRMSVAELEAGFRRAVAAVFSAEATRRRAQIRRAVWSKHPRLRHATA